MKVIEWLPLASTNRFEQLDYIAQDNPLAAISQDEQIEHQVDMLMQHPQMGRPGRKKGTRELVISRTPFIASRATKSKSSGCCTARSNIHSGYARCGHTQQSLTKIQLHKS